MKLRTIGGKGLLKNEKRDANPLLSERLRWVMPDSLTGYPDCLLIRSW